MNTTLSMVLPDARLRDSYRSLIAEFVEAHEQLTPFTLAFEHHDFDAFLSRLAACARGVGVPDGFVAHSTFWLVRDDHEVLGVANLRHSLTPALLNEGGSIGYGVRPSARRQGLGIAILQHTLARAAGLGLTRVLLTCDKRNVASARAIVRNGGVLDSEEYLADQGKVIQRYWIENISERLV